MKKWIALLFAGILMGGIMAGCSGDSTGAEPTDASKPAEGSKGEEPKTDELTKEPGATGGDSGAMGGDAGAGAPTTGGDAGAAAPPTGGGG